MFFVLILALYNDATRGTMLCRLRTIFDSMTLILDTLLARFDKHIAPLLINVFHKVTHLDVIQQWQSNLTILKRISNQPICGRIFSNNRSPDQAQFSHSYPNLYKYEKEHFYIFIRSEINNSIDDLVYSKTNLNKHLEFFNRMVS